MGNGISKTYPAGILRAPQIKRVSWGHEQVKTIPNRHDETVPLLNTHEVARRTAQIKQTPIVTRPVAPPAPIPTIKKLPPPKWNKWQKFWRGREEVIFAAFVLTGLVGGLAGPFCLLVPAALVLYGIACWGYRRYGPQPETVARAQLTAEHLAKKYEKRVEVMRAAGNYEQAKAYQFLVKKLR